MSPALRSLYTKRELYRFQAMAIKRGKDALWSGNGYSDGCDIVAWFEDVAEHAGAVQKDTLRRIVEANRGTEYLGKWLGGDFGDVQDPDELEELFRSSVPVASHADLEPYIQRVADGDTSPVLTEDPITMLSLSSGTTEGKQKYVPFTRFSAQSTVQVFRLAAAYRSRVIPIKPGGKILEFIYSGKQFQTKGGIKAGTATTHYFGSEEFKIKQKTTQSFNCSPPKVISSGDYNQTTYCHLLLGLISFHDIEFVASTFAHSIVQALTAFEELWEELCEDIKHGTLSTRVTSPEIRKTVLSLMVPNPTLSTEITRKCRELESSGWGSLIPQLWPNAKYVYSIMTGSMLPYSKKLRHYAGGKVALVSADYGSTESWIGVNLNPLEPPERVVFTVVPTFAYFEFIPLSKMHHDEALGGSRLSCDDDFVEGEPLPLSNVEVGKQYEVVLTTFTGLYRCRLGDVVEVAGFYRGSPQLSFVCRRKLILTINIDKNTEKDLQLVVDKASRLLNADTELVDFTSHADASCTPGHYVVYWELKGSAGDEVVSQCCSEMDAAFRDHGYVTSRRTGSIAPLELRVVAPGTFRRIMEYCIAKGAAMSQFKTPRCTRNQEMLWILDQFTVSRCWSTAYA